jgi:hypothetical protein
MSAGFADRVALGRISTKGRGENEDVKVRVAGFGLSLAGFRAGIEQSLSDPLDTRSRQVLLV